MPFACTAGYMTSKAAKSLPGQEHKIVRVVVGKPGSFLRVIRHRRAGSPVKTPCKVTSFAPRRRFSSRFRHRFTNFSALRQTLNKWMIVHQPGSPQKRYAPAVMPAPATYSLPHVRNVIAGSRKLFTQGGEGNVLVSERLLSARVDKHVEAVTFCRGDDGLIAADIRVVIITECDHANDPCLAQRQ